jgi:hypothetical protein
VLISQLFDVLTGFSTFPLEGDKKENAGKFFKAIADEVCSSFIEIILTSFIFSFCLMKLSNWNCLNLVPTLSNPKSSRRRQKSSEF